MRTIDLRSSFARSSLFALAVFSLVVAFVEGLAGAEPELPTEPFIVPAHDPSEWTITLTYDRATPPDPSNPAASVPLIKQIKVVKAGNYRRETSFWSNGAQSESWYVGNVFIEHQPSWPAGYLNARLMGSALNDDFSLAWTNVSYYKRKEEMQGHSCYVYEASNAALNPSLILSKDMAAKATDSNTSPEVRNLIKSQMAQAEKLANSTTKVWIDTETRLPVRVVGDGVTKDFEFSKEAPKLQLPPDYQKQLDLLKKMYPNTVKSLP